MQQIHAGLTDDVENEVLPNFTQFERLLILNRELNLLDNENKKDQSTLRTNEPRKTLLSQLNPVAQCNWRLIKI